MINSYRRFVSRLASRFGLDYKIVNIAIIIIVLLLINNMIDGRQNLTIDNLAFGLIIIFAILPAIILHEQAHGFAAKVLGDETASRLGRISLNPLNHIRIWAFALLAGVVLFDIGNIFLYIIIGINLAKPVPINPMFFDDPRKDMAKVGAAGPITNIILCTIGLFLLKFTINLNLNNEYLRTYLIYFSQLNIHLAFFNLIPIPPLDGSRIVYGLLPDNAARSYISLEKYGFFIIIILWMFNGFGFVLRLSTTFFQYLGGLIL
ncbi:MAG: site-2 protease family protein [Candidatus Muiribacterium halophilum]|uniref:Site-2 protease family protein n=1 Tax=Muiribacterium halophilum TaxID=2053465 RepID=A0A2N5ZAV7_MUIH1|nr:MAG: site-2 protease family protein [Candidatus Muirbacterium halophilum]